MKIYILYALQLFLMSCAVKSEKHVCDFSKRSNSTGSIRGNVCEIKANPLDEVTLVCPEGAKSKCFEQVHLSDEVEKVHNVADLDIALYGSVVTGNTLLISPTVTQNFTFYCFCNIEDNSEEAKTEEKKSPENKQEKKEEAKNADVEVIMKEEEDRFSDNVSKIRKKSKNKGSDNSNGAGDNDDEEELIVGVEEPVVVKGEKKKGSTSIMKVIVSKNDTKTKGCVFGLSRSDYFTMPFHIEKYGGSRVCRIEAKPDELVGFKCFYDTRGFTEPRNCFTDVLYNNEETKLSTILPSHISYSSEKNSEYALYLRLPHFVNSDYVIQCKCRSSLPEYDNYVFELLVKAGESETLKESFKEK